MAGLYEKCRETGDIPAPYIFYAYYFGTVILPVIADAAAVAGEPR
jgi:hypothetical protein